MASYLRCLTRPGAPQIVVQTLRHGAYPRPLGIRQLNKSATENLPKFAFAFDIDGVLLRASDPIPGAHEALSLLQKQRVPFILLTNGGGKPESERVEELSQQLNLPLDTSVFVQSHTPFADMEQYKDKTVLVIGGDGEKCRDVAQSYGYKSVVIPADILVEQSSIWPFSQQYLDYYRSFARPLPRPISKNPAESLKIDAMFVYNDPRDWGLDATIVLDLLLSKNGVMGTLSPKNNNPHLPNRGYLQDGQPPLFYSNPDLWWAAKYHLSRLGQGAFRESLEGLWNAVTGGEELGVELKKTVIGKPYPITFEFAEKRLLRHRKALFGPDVSTQLQRAYMVGDNPEADILGGNSYMSPEQIKWYTILVQTGVYKDGPPSQTPTNIAKNVYEGVKWALAKEGWPHDIGS